MTPRSVLLSLALFFSTPTHAIYRNTTTIGVELLVPEIILNKSSTPRIDPATYDNQRYITSYISTPTVVVRYGATYDTVRNSTLLAIMSEDDWAEHREGYFNSSCIDGQNTHFIPGCKETDIIDCPTEGLYNLQLPEVPGIYLIVAYINNGSLWHDQFGMESAYVSKATAANSLDDLHRDTTSIMCYQHWLRPENSTTEGWYYLGNHLEQIGHSTRIYNAPAFWATTSALTLLEGGAMYEYRVVYESGVYLRTNLTLQSLSNCYHQLVGSETGGIWSQTTMQPMPRHLRLLTINGNSDWGRSDPFINDPNNKTAHVDVQVYASNNLHQFQHMNVTCHVTHWITAKEIHDDAVWSPVRLTPQFDRDYQQLPIDGVTPHLKIPIVVTDDEYLHKWCDEDFARTIGLYFALAIVFVLCTRLIGILWYNFFDLTDLRDANNTMSVRGNGATRLDVSELGAQRHYLISAWPFIWMLQTIAMCSQLKIVQENVGIYAIVTSIATTPVYIASVPMPIPNIMVELPFYPDGAVEEDTLDRTKFIGKKKPIVIEKSTVEKDATANNTTPIDSNKEATTGDGTTDSGNDGVDAGTNNNSTNGTTTEASIALTPAQLAAAAAVGMDPNKYNTLYPIGKLGVVTMQEASDSYLKTVHSLGGEEAIDLRDDGINGDPIVFETDLDAPPVTTTTMISGKERNYDPAGSITALWRIIIVTVMVWSIFLCCRYLLVRYINEKMKRLALQYRLCPVFDPRIVVGPGGAVTVKPMSKMQHEEMMRRIEMMENKKVKSKQEEEEEENNQHGLVLAKDEEKDEDEDQKMTVLTMTAPEGLELIAKRTKDYMTTRATVIFLIVFSWPSMFQACGGGMTSGILSGQIIGSFMMLVGVVLFSLFLAYFLMVVTLGTSYRRINAPELLDQCFEMQRTNVEAHVILKIIGGKVGRWSVANRDYRKIFYDVGHLFDFFIFSHGYIDEDERMEKEKAEKALEEGNDGTQVIIKKEKAYESRKPYLFSIYLLFHFGIQGLIVGSEANSDTAGLSQAVHFFILQCLFTFAIFFVWPHNVPVGNVVQFVSSFLFTSVVGLTMFVHPLVRATMVDITIDTTTAATNPDPNNTLDISLMEQMMLLLTVLSVMPLLIVEIAGTMSQSQLFLIYVGNEYALSSLVSVCKSIKLCCIYIKHEYKKQQQVRRRRRQKYANPNKRTKQVKEQDDAAAAAAITDIMGNGKETVTIDLAQQQMNRYVNKDDEDEEFLDVDGNRKKDKNLNGFTFTEEEIAEWVPNRKIKKYVVGGGNNEEEDDGGEEEETSSDEDDEDDKDEFGLSTTLSYEERETAANEIQEELTNVYRQLKELGFNPAGTKKPEEIDAHLKVAKKVMRKKWVRSELRSRFGNEVLVSSGANLKVLKKDREEAMWSIEKKKKEKERRAKEWEKYAQTQNGSGAAVNAAGFGLEANATSSRGRD